MSYDRAITVFSPDAHLFQVDYAQEAVQKSSAALSNTSLSLRLRRNPQPCSRTVRKICALDENVFMAFAGLTADARVLINRARVECQSHRLTVDDPITVEYITCYVSSLKQHYTQSNGRRPFGISTLIVGFDDDGTPNLYQTDPSGTYHAWKVGRPVYPLAPREISNDFFLKAELVYNVPSPKRTPPAKSPTPSSARLTHYTLEGIMHLNACS
uniref:Proteasome alpha-type subunits domain-containing protein n=1 Tax=Electrophorus electricus TaxID=8005 RepID=A0AAY5E9P4_ELEEL